MNPSSSDRGSFHKLLAGAFFVQSTGLDVYSSSTVFELRHLIDTRQIDSNMVMRILTHCARKIANASGAAIGLLQSNQLTYVAASGSIAAYMGRQVTAMLSVGTNSTYKTEILRVENAEKETRIEAAICRQFGAKSLLILPIYCDRILAGIIEIFFGEAHVFQDFEVSAYHSMASLAGEALAQSGENEDILHESTTSKTIRQQALDQSFSSNIQRVIEDIHRQKVIGALPLFTKDKGYNRNAWRRNETNMPTHSAAEPCGGGSKRD